MFTNEKNAMIHDCVRYPFYEMQLENKFKFDVLPVAHGALPWTKFLIVTRTFSLCPLILQFSLTVSSLTLKCQMHKARVVNFAALVRMSSTGRNPNYLRARSCSRPIVVLKVLAVSYNFNAPLII